MCLNFYSFSTDNILSPRMFIFVICGDETKVKKRFLLIRCEHGNTLRSNTEFIREEVKVYDAHQQIFKLLLFLALLGWFNLVFGIEFERTPIENLFF